jgi:hypothetical protein
VNLSVLRDPQFQPPRVLSVDELNVELDVWSRRAELWREKLARDDLPGGFASDGRDLLRAGIIVAECVVATINDELEHRAIAERYSREARQWSR